MWDFQFLSGMRPYLQQLKKYGLTDFQFLSGMRRLAKRPRLGPKESFNSFLGCDRQKS